MFSNMFLRSFGGGFKLLCLSQQILCSMLCNFAFAIDIALSISYVQLERFGNLFRYIVLCREAWVARLIPNLSQRKSKAVWMTISHSLSPGTRQKGHEFQSLCSQSSSYHLGNPSKKTSPLAFFFSPSILLLPLGACQSAARHVPVQLAPVSNS